MSWYESEQTRTCHSQRFFAHTVHNTVHLVQNTVLLVQDTAHLVQNTAYIVQDTIHIVQNRKPPLTQPDIDTTLANQDWQRPCAITNVNYTYSYVIFYNYDTIYIYYLSENEQNHASEIPAQLDMYTFVYHITYLRRTRKRFFNILINLRLIRTYMQKTDRYRHSPVWRRCVTNAEVNGPSLVWQLEAWTHPIHPIDSAPRQLARTSFFSYFSFVYSTVTNPLRNAEGQ